MKTTQTQQTIIERPFGPGGVVLGCNGAELMPLYGSGEYRAAQSLVNKGFGQIVSSSKHPYHPANRFLKLNDPKAYNWNTKEIG